MSDKEDLLKKIKSLASSGIGGEKENAQALLDRLMEKYNISEIDIDTSVKTPTCFTFNCSAQARLLNQIIYMITGKAGWSYREKRPGPHRKEIWTECTETEHTEISICLDFYWHYLQQELEVFYDAFMMTNDLYPSNPEDQIEITDEMIKRARQASLIANGLDKHVHHQLIDYHEEEE